MTSVDAFRKAVNCYYADDNPCGGTLHILFDDGNFRDSDVEHCITYALEKEDLNGFMLAMAFRGLTVDERAEVLRVEKPYWWEIYECAAP